jgi:small-conductance mechanosensitive channel
MLEPATASLPGMFTHLQRAQPDLARRLTGTSPLKRIRKETDVKDILIATLLAIFATAAFAVVVTLTRAGFARLHGLLNSWQGTRIRSIRIQRLELLSAQRITEILQAACRLIGVTLLLVITYAYLSVVLSFFPWTRGFSSALVGYVVSVAAVAARAIMAEIPNLFMIGIIALISRYVIKFCGLIFREIGRGTVSVPGFYREWADPSYKITRFLVLAFSAVVMFPYIPGHSSPAFQGVSIFVGVLFSLGSAGAVSNIIAGVLLTYTRAFQIGDRIKIGDTFGDVLEKSLLATRIRTIKNEDVTVPNALVLGSHVVNFSSCVPLGGSSFTRVYRSAMMRRGGKSTNS